MSKALTDLVVDALEDVKGHNIVTLDVTGLTDVMDTLVVASGNTNRQVKALADNVVEKCKAQGYQPLGVEGMESADWILIDLGDVVAHIMLPETRTFYDLEKLWSMSPEDLKRR